MNAITKSLLTLAMIFTAACNGSPTGASSFAASDGEVLTSVSAAATSLSFTSTKDYSNATAQTATGGTGSISFTGSVQTSTPCVNVTASESTRKSVITVTVTATNTGDFCTQVITNNNYEGTLSGLAAGTYTFNVVHNVNGSTSTAYSSSIVVR